ncbi:3-hydroxyisobutyryl-CoA hydrolase 1-like isoform X2 [Euphorbia lathyris]|uniref:3-hydroxyisobutyryl-CoA hydrolase 1-like isoform X2 n=1 Tax=Euphorbia lathyris TaxID=212925 RepID=UPI00331361B1
MDSHCNFNKQFNQVIVEGDSFYKKVILNRPDKLNSLSYGMISELSKHFRAIEMDPTVKIVILKGNGKAFCAGGDVVSVVGSMFSGHWSFGASFYKKQLQLDYLLATYKKPLLSFIDGMVMGGGAGLSLHGRFKIVTENTVFASPEVAIGLFPDCGASYFLSRLPGYFGEFLGLTGARLDGAEMLNCGLATHFVFSKDLALLEKALETQTSPDMTSINQILSNFAQKPIIKESSTFKRSEIINKCFSKDTVEEILLALEQEARIKSETWIIMAIKSIKSGSPISLKITLRSIREGRTQNLSECLIREYTICCNIARATASTDLYEGRRAILVDKDKKPKWEPSKLELVSFDMVQSCFSGIDEDDWKYLQLPVRNHTMHNAFSSSNL